MKGIEKIDGKDLRDGDTRKTNFRCKKCNKLLAEVEGKNNIKIVCSRCKTINEFK